MVAPSLSYEDIQFIILHSFFVAFLEDMLDSVVSDPPRAVPLFLLDHLPADNQRVLLNVCIFVGVDLFVTVMAYGKILLIDYCLVVHVVVCPTLPVAILDFTVVLMLRIISLYLSRAIYAVSSALLDVRLHSLSHLNFN